MAIAHAIKFLKQMDQLHELRSALYGCVGPEAQLARLRLAGYPFDGAEFEEAVDHLHTSCQTYQDADELMNKVHWMRMVFANA